LTTFTQQCAVKILSSATADIFGENLCNAVQFREALKKHYHTQQEHLSE